MNNLNYENRISRLAAFYYDTFIFLLPAQLIHLWISAAFHIPLTGIMFDRISIAEFNYSTVHFSHFTEIAGEAKRVEFIILMLELLTGWIYAAGLQSSRWQATIGQKICKLTVTTLDGQRISFLRASVRHVARILCPVIFVICFNTLFPSPLPAEHQNLISYFSVYVVLAPFCYIIAFANDNKRKQTLHDMIAGTVVLRNTDN